MSARGVCFAGLRESKTVGPERKNRETRMFEVRVAWKLVILQQILLYHSVIGPRFSVQSENAVAEIFIREKFR